MIGYCRFCGQSRMVDGGPEMTEDELNQLATSICECPGATHDAWKQSTMEVFGQDLEMMFGKHPEVKTLLRYAGEQIIDGKMLALTIKRSGEQTIGLKLKDKGLCITKSVRIKEESVSYG